MNPSYCWKCGTMLLIGKVVEFHYSRETGEKEGSLIDGLPLRTCRSYYVEPGHDQFVWALHKWEFTPRELKGNYEDTDIMSDKG
jgi:hypothetical protein